MSVFAARLFLPFVFSRRGADVEAQHAVASAASPSALVTKPIRDVRVGQRVITSASGDGSTMVDMATWRRLRLRTEQRWSDGTVDEYDVDTLQPPEWIAAHRAEPGNRVPLPLDLVEMGTPAELDARVIANEACPTLDDGPGRVVLTTVNHLNQFLFDLGVEDARGRVEQLHVTGYHKLFSRSHDEWRSVADLSVGETIRGLSGDLTVKSVARIPGTHRVYNMTVEGEHVFHVSQLGVLAHNNNCNNPPFVSSDGLAKSGEKLKKPKKVPNAEL